MDWAGHPRVRIFISASIRATAIVTFRATGRASHHVTTGLFVIYRKSDSNTQRRARIGSHSELFG